MDKPLIHKIAILGGTGDEGPGLALRWANAGYPVIIGSRKAEKAQATAKELNEKIGIDTVQGMENQDAVRNANICVLTVVHTAHDSILEDLRGDLQGKILVDTTSRVDFRDPKPPPAPSAARKAQDILGEDVQVVAAFQSVPAHALRRNVGEPLEMDTLVCADDPEAADEVIKLAGGLGLRAFYAGDLDDALTIEGLTAILIKMNRAHESKTGAIRVTGIER
jgi:hypothetical protein